MAARSLPRKLADGLRLLWLRPDERACLRLIRRSDAFDRRFYLSSNPRLHPLFRLFPERHYLREGEAMGLMPNPRFAPFAYLAFNPDLAGQGIRPLEHFLRQGAAEGRSGYEVPDPGEGLEAPPPPAPPADPAPVAVALHLFYPELWPEFAALLRSQLFRFDLFVTLAGPAARDPGLTDAIRQEFPEARIWCPGNRGRDILPFLRLLTAGLLAPYAAVCKLHGKLSPHRRDGADWRRQLVAAVLGAPEDTRRRLAQFLADDEAGLLVAEGQILGAPADWGPNLPRLEELLARLGPDARARAQIRSFPAGSVYWVKAAVLAQLAALRLTPEEFEPERGLVDGTTAHALERALGPLTLAAGLRMITPSGLQPDV